jgi:hypothetical protein
MLHLVSLGLLALLVLKVGDQFIFRKIGVLSMTFFYICLGRNRFKWLLLFMCRSLPQAGHIIIDLFVINLGVLSVLEQADHGSLLLICREET